MRRFPHSSLNIIFTQYDMCWVPWVVCPVLYIYVCVCVCVCVSVYVNGGGGRGRGRGGGYLNSLGGISIIPCEISWVPCSTVGDIMIHMGISPVQWGNAQYPYCFMFIYCGEIHDTHVWVMFNALTFFMIPPTVQNLHYTGWSHFASCS